MTSFKFISAKTDGLGSRLKSIVIAMHLANKFDKGFAYRWQPKLGHYGENFHSVGTADTIFAEKFIRESLIVEREYNASHYCRFRRSDKVTLDAVDRLAHSGKLGVIIDALQPGQVLGNSGGICSFAKEFDQIEFSPVIAEALKMASTVDLPQDSVAIHIRGGDIIYGPFKHVMKHQDKAVPLPLIRDFTEQVLASGRTPLLFMQDPVDRRFVEDLEGVVLSEDLLYGSELPTSAARSLYDIKLMSRCSEIYSGSSRFSEIASMISGKPLRDVNQEYDGRAKFAIIDRETRLDRRYSPEHVAYAILSQLHCGVELRIDEQLSLLDRARSADPGNGLYILLAVCLLMEIGDLHLAEGYASKGISDFSRKHVAMKSSSADRYEESPFVDSFVKQAYSDAAINNYLKPFLVGSFADFPVLSVLSYHARFMLGDSNEEAVADNALSDTPGLSEVSEFLSSLREK